MTGNSEQAAFEARLRLQIEAYHAAALAYAAVKLGLPDRMGERAWTAEQLAGELGLSPPHLFRFLRGLVTLGICRELPDGGFTLAAGGWSLRSDSHSRLAKKVQIVVEQYWQPWSDLVSCLKTGQPSFDQVFGASVWDWRSRHREQGALFESYLTGETFDQAGPIVEVFEFAAGVASVADIGGGCGGLLAALLIAYPRLDGALLDRPHIIEMARAFLRAFDAFRLTERIEFVPGDFFAGIPIEADLYLLKGVLQQWDDQAATRDPDQLPERDVWRGEARHHRAADAGARRGRPERRHGRSAHDDHHRRTHAERRRVRGAARASRSHAREGHAHPPGPRHRRGRALLRTPSFRRKPESSDDSSEPFMLDPDFAGMTTAGDGSSPPTVTCRDRPSPRSPRRSACRRWRQRRW